MIEFCRACKVSLPKSDLTIKDGKVFASHDYICPECGKLANPSGNSVGLEPDENVDVIVKDGRINVEE